MTRPNYPIVTIVLFTRSTLPVPAEEIKPKAWALSDEKATRFNEKKKNNNDDNYLEEKFFSGQQGLEDNQVTDTIKASFQLEAVNS